MAQRLRGAETSSPPYSDEKVANRDFIGFGWEIAHATVTRRPPISLNTMVPRTGGYTHDVGVWDSSIVQGPFSVRTCQTRTRKQRTTVRVKSRIHVLQKLTGLISPYTNPVSRFQVSLLKPQLKALNPRNGLWQGFVSWYRAPRNPLISLRSCMGSALDLCGFGLVEQARRSRTAWRT
jgi:hypothetical protein